MRMDGWMLTRDMVWFLGFSLCHAFFFFFSARSFVGGGD